MANDHDATLAEHAPDFHGAELVRLSSRGCLLQADVRGRTCASPARSLLLVLQRTGA
jgi:hypothetical protein